MEESLKFALIQTDNIWENIDQNLNNLTIKLNSITNDIDVIVLPELFSTGFTMNAKSVAENMEGKAVLWMLEQAKIKDSLLMGSLLIKEGKIFYNRLVAAFPDGKIKIYDKRHLFSYAKENHVFSTGNKKLIFDYKGFRFSPLICYDLRFPVWSRNTENIDVLIYVANWPNARMFAWDTLLKARAIENLCYTIGVNRVGLDNNKLIYSGHSAVYNALGETLLDFEEGKQGIKTIILEKENIKNFREKFRFLDDQDQFKIVY